MIGGGSCSICKSPNTSKVTCPCNPDAKNKDYGKHPLWNTVCPEKKSPEKKSPDNEQSEFDVNIRAAARIEPEKSPEKKSLEKRSTQDLESLRQFILKNYNHYRSHLDTNAENTEQFILSVTELFIGYNDLTSLPNAIGKLVNLIGLYVVNNNKLTSLPETIGKLVNLTLLDVSGNQLTSLPETIGEITNLTVLNVSNNIELTSLPETIGKLTNLAELYLGNNDLTSLPKTLEKLVNLTHLNVSNNQLTSLPETIRKLTNLTHLNVGYNKLTSLPEIIGDLINLRILDVRGNKLISLPKTIGELTNLEDLIAHNNKLISLPETIGKLSLGTLDVSYNKLEELPEIHAAFLNLEGNPVRKYRNYSYKFKAHLENVGNKVSKLKKDDNMDSNRELQKMANEFCKTFVDNRKINEIRVMAKRLDIKNSDKKSKEELCSQIQSVIVLKSEKFLPYIISAESFR
jgi:hypothetical protein